MGNPFADITDLDELVRKYQELTDVTTQARGVTADQYVRSSDAYRSAFLARYDEIEAEQAAAKV